MAVNLAAVASDFKIVSRTDGNLPVGINPTNPTFQYAHLDAPLRYWKFTEAGDNKYLLSIAQAYPYTGVIDNKIAASTNPEDQVTWEITYHDIPEGGYTIARADDHDLVWTVNPKSGEVEIGPIPATPSNSPQIPDTQLFAIQLYKK